MKRLYFRFQVITIPNSWRNKSLTSLKVRSGSCLVLQNLFDGSKGRTKSPRLSLYETRRSTFRWKSVKTLGVNGSEAPSGTQMINRIGGHWASAGYEPKAFFFWIWCSLRAPDCRTSDHPGTNRFQKLEKLYAACLFNAFFFTPPSSLGTRFTSGMKIFFNFQSDNLQ